MTTRIPEKILFVDDDINVLEGFQRRLRNNFNIETATGGEDGLEVIKNNGPFAVIVADMRMPRMDGVQFLAQAKEMTPSSVRIMLTGNADQATAAKAVNEGSIFRFLSKPCPMEDVGKALVAGIEQYRLITAEKELLESTLNGSIEILTEILSMIDPQAFGQALQIKEYCKIIGPLLEIENTWELQSAAMFSCLGLVTIPAEVRAKVQQGELLSQAEQDVMSRIPEIGHELLMHIPRLKDVSEIVLYQNKSFDGSGFPFDTVAGEMIPYGARILKIIADLVAFETKGSNRKDAMAEMLNRRGYYDPKLFSSISHIFDSLVLNKDRSAPTLEVKIGELQMGDLLVSNIETIDDRLLVAKGNLISRPILERLRNYAELVEVKEPIWIERVT